METSVEAIRDHVIAARVGVRVICYPTIINPIPAWSMRRYITLPSSCYKLEIEHTNIDLGAPTQPIIIKNPTSVRRVFSSPFLFSYVKILSNDLISSNCWSIDFVFGTVTIAKKRIDLWRTHFMNDFHLVEEKKDNTIICILYPRYIVFL